ncbi:MULTISPECIES: glycosyltransferase [Pseudonocardia]|uniref:Glycosyltransferase involved in cell wall biosynthesis n=1 Tax=Pseudonocardia alni TaxID=33907 RepID=A0A852VXQ4_PSEA5|nr:MULTISPECIES: glycosyltransferase [Pseudonocardia]MCO7196870.1 glycosyltransferase [Pseudonocardia sp. McavD-2-B]NYG00111.1 glycosyltransferase involved in cell wall biosynthesis [Pseudonocardia antarctica]
MSTHDPARLPPVTARIALIASARYPIREPFPGGLEAHTAGLASRLRRRGHDVTVFGAPGSDPGLRVREMAVLPPISRAARSDVGMPPEWFLAEHHSYLELLLALSRERGRYDVVHNNSLHYLPLALADTLDAPVLTTLHTPPTPWMESAVRLGDPQRLRFAAVSAHTARAWAPTGARATVVRNGVDTAAWEYGPGGGVPVWSGRVVPEKGPVEAIRAARLAGTGLRLAGPCPDRAFFDSCVAPLLGDGVDYLGHLDHRALARLVGDATVAVVSPCWDEPYGLVVAEALACGTPIAGFARGALPEIVDPLSGVLAEPGDVEALAEAIRAASLLSRTDARRHAEATCSAEVMIDGYERLYRALAAV